MMRSNRPSAAATTHTSHTSHAPCKRPNWCWHGVRGACDLRAAVATHNRLARIIAHAFRNHLRAILKWRNAQSWGARR
eukprot:1283148-Lingulodinium_polyedra.AAC.1